jgi:two-component system, cell cycle sensor histidine kinase and response regulator CckA
MEHPRNIKSLKIALLFLLAAFTILFYRQSLSDDSISGKNQQKTAASSLHSGSVKPSRIIVADDSSHAPFSFLNTEGRPAGIIIDIWKLWSRKTGIPVEFHLMPWDSALSAVQNDEADAIGSLVKTEKRQNIFTFANLLYATTKGIFFHKQIQGIRGIEDLQGFPLGIVKGDSSREMIMQRYPEALFLEYPGSEPLIQAAIKGEIKVFVTDSEVARFYLAQFDRNNVFHEASRSVDANWKYAGVKRGNDRILGVVQDGFNQISKKEIHTIIDSWTERPLSSKIIWPAVQFLSAVIVPLLTIVLLWNFSLRKKVAKAIGDVERRNLDLQASEARFKAFFDLAPFNCAVTDLEGRYRMVNQTLCRQIGRQEEEIVGHTRDELGIIVDNSCSKDLRNTLLDTGAVKHQEVVVTMINGPLYVIYSSRLIESCGEQLILSASVDISERKRMEGALRESENRFNMLFQSAPIPLAFASEVDEYRATTWNEAWYRTFGYSQEEADRKSGADFHLWVDPEDRRRFIDMARKQNHVAGWEALLRRCDGRIRTCEVFGRFIGKTGHQILMAAYLDITESKQAEMTLKESEQRFSKAFHSSPAPMSISDIETGRFIDVNEKLLQMLERTRNEIIGRTSYEIGMWVDPEVRVRLGKRVQESGSIKDEKVQFIAKSGKIRDVLCSTEIITLEGAEAMLSLLYDCTDRNKAEKEKEKLQAQLQQSQKMESVGRLAGGVAHDYNNMLGVIIGHTELAMLKTDKSHAMQPHLRQIMNAAQRSSELTQQLLAFARRQTIAPKILDLNASVATTLQMVRVLIGENIELVWTPGDEIYPVKIDPIQFNQMLMNLCVNARDAISGTGRITIETVRLILDEAYCASNAYFVPGDYVVLIVSDNGCGIAKEIQSKIFEPFFTTKGAGKGTGLGLATAYGIVKQNDGFINVYSEPGRGTTFRIYLPRHEVLTVDSRKPEVDSIPRGLGEVVLVVEDEAFMLNIIAIMLTDLGYRVLAASTPAEALHFGKEQAGAIHLLMTDIVMPEMNGRELEQHIQKSNPGIRCLFMSGYTANVISHHGVLDKDVHFIQKPFTLKDMAIKVRETLDQKPEDYGHNSATFPAAGSENTSTLLPF